jgi:hypothetical protein
MSCESERVAPAARASPASPGSHASNVHPPAWQVRNSQGDVVQFLYGEDGMDAVRIEGQAFEYLKWDVSAAIDWTRLGVEAVCEGSAVGPASRPAALQVGHGASPPCVRLCRAVSG